MRAAPGSGRPEQECCFLPMELLAPPGFGSRVRRLGGVGHLAGAVCVCSCLWAPRVRKHLERKRISLVQEVGDESMKLVSDSLPGPPRDS